MRTLTLLAGASCAAFAFGSGEQAVAQSVPPVSAPESVSAQEPGQLRGNTVDEVVVTASRRSESIREVPTAVSAYSGANLKDAQIANLADLASATPNLQISTSGTNVDINIRGVGNGNLNQAGGEPGVAVQFDGVYLGQAGLALTNLLDISRIEILRGPQGTLFGRNATGGAINIIPNTPTRQLSYGADISLGADPTAVRSSAYVSGPLDAAGAVTARLSAGENYNEGYTKNLAPMGPRRLDPIDEGAVRAQIEWRPSADFDLRLLAEYQKEKDSGPAAFLLGTPADTPLPPPLQGSPVGDPGRREAYADMGSKKLESKTVNVTFDWSLGGGHLKALASYNSSNQSFWQDGDAALADFTDTLYADKAHQEYVELIYTSDPSQRFNYVLGTNYYDERFEQNIQVPTLGFPYTFSEGGVVDTRSYAFFAHAQYNLWRSAKLFAGIRYTDDKKDINEFNNYAGTAQDSAEWDRVTYEAGLTYDFTHSITGYAKYATGYKSGGFSLGSLSPAFNPETNANYEAGLKGVYLDGRLQANLSAFHMEYDNLQVNQIVGVSAFVTNAARATTDGVELETVVRPIDRLRIDASASYLDARFDSFMTADSARPQLGVLDLEGHDLPGAPHATASVGAFYDIPVPTGTATAGGRYDWKSRLYFSEFNLPISSQGAVGKLDLFLNYRSASGRWTAGLYALNVTDEQVRSNVLVVSALLGSLALAQYQPARQVGVSLGYHF